MVLPLHLHTLWIAIVFFFLLLACVLVAFTLTISYGWIRRKGDGLNERARRRLVNVSGLGILLSGLFWTPVLLSLLFGYGDVFFEFPQMLFVYSVGFSSSGVIGGYILWKLRSTPETALEYV